MRDRRPAVCLDLTWWWARAGRVARFALAVFAPLVAIALTVIIRPLWEGSPYQLALASVAVPAVLGGKRVGLVSVAVALVGVLFAVVAPRFDFGIPSLGELVRVSVFLGVATGAAFVCGGVRERYVREQEALAVQSNLGAELAQSRDQLRLVMDALPALIGYVDRNEKYVFVNAGYEEWFKRSRADIVGKSVAAILDEATYRSVQPNIRAALSGRRIDFQCFHPHGPGGTGAELAVTYVPHVSNGQTVGFFVLERDVTEQERGRRALDDAKKQAETANRTKDEFLAILGHELRNPLSPILTALQLMRMRGKDGPEVKIVERQADHLVRLVNDLLDISRITRGKVELRRERLELATVALRGLEMASPLLEQRRQEVDFQVPAEGLLIEGDTDRLAQVVSNLLTNASKYSEPGTKIHLSAGRAGKSGELSVRDHGVGIAPEMLGRIFDIFVQQPQGLDRAKGGLGLGLTIVRSLVELHGGTVEARSEGLGHGSEFIVRLPLAPGAEEFEQVAPRKVPRLTMPSPTSLSSEKRILVVDDNVDAAGSIAEVLTELGYDVQVAHDGPTALKVAQWFKPNICLLDIGLPVMDGYDLARRIREVEGMPDDLRLIAITGYGQDADRRRSREAGFNAHVVKPVSLDVLTSVVRN